MWFARKLGTWDSKMNVTKGQFLCSILTSPAKRLIRKIPNLFHLKDFEGFSGKGMWHSFMYTTLEIPTVRPLCKMMSASPEVWFLCELLWECSEIHKFLANHIGIYNNPHFVSIHVGNSPMSLPFVSTTMESFKQNVMFLCNSCWAFQELHIWCNSYSKSSE